MRSNNPMSIRCLYRERKSVDFRPPKLTPVSTLIARVCAATFWRGFPLTQQEWGANRAVRRPNATGPSFRMPRFSGVAILLLPFLNGTFRNDAGENC
jgi:hypothetical protein